MRGKRACATGVFLLMHLAACGRIGFETLDVDTGVVDASMDATFDTGAMDATTDAQADATMDARTDASEADASNDADTSDAALDATTDAGVDAGPIEPTFPPVSSLALSAVAAHTCFVNAGALACWGDNADGQLGLGDTTTRLSPAYVALPSGGAVAQASAGETHTCAIEAVTGALYCWGRNDSGQLGTGDRTTRNTPTRVVGLPRMIQVSAGYAFTCAISEDNGLWCWGNNSEGQFGLADNGTPVISSDIPMRTSTDLDWIQIETGQSRACGLRAPGILWCAGRNTLYGFGLGTNIPTQIRSWTRATNDSDWTRISVSQDGGCGLRGNQGAYCWGTFGSTPVTQLTTPQNVNNVSQWVSGAAGTFNACGVIQGNALVCWGRNMEGQLGCGDNLDKVDGTFAGLDFNWASVVMGRFHTCAQKLNDTIFCTGENALGQLGLGDAQRRNILTRVMLP